MEFRVDTTNYTYSDLSMDPAQYVAGLKQMIPLPAMTPAELSTARQRTFEYGRANATDARMRMRYEMRFASPRNLRSPT